MPDPLEGLRREIDKLRDWRHDHASPVLAAVRALLEADPPLASLGGRIEALHGRVEAMERQVEEMESQVHGIATREQIAQAVVAAQKEEKGLILTRAQKITAASAAVVLFAVAIVDFVRTFTG